MAHMRQFKKIFILQFVLLSLVNSIKSQTNFNLSGGKNISAGNTSGFIKNCGQINTLEGDKATNVFFSYSSSNADIFITNRGISYVYIKPTYTDSILQTQTNNLIKSTKTEFTQRKHFEVERVDANLIGAKIDTNQMVLEYSSSTARFNIYTNEIQIVGQRSIKKLTFKNVYPGIDWVLYDASDGKQQKIKYDFIVNAKSNAAKICIQYSPNVKIKLNEKEGLTIKSKLGFIDEGNPVGFKKNTPSITKKLHYQLDKNNTIHFDLNEVAKNKFPFIIDPDLYWGTYIHTITPYGTYHNTIKTTDITTDNNGNIFVAGYCFGVIKFPTLNPGGGAFYKDVYDSINGSNIYLKFSETGVLLWATYFTSGAYINSSNGTTLEGGVHITVDSKGNLITASKFYYNKPPPFKNNGGYFDSTSTSNCYLAKFDGNGVLLWCTKWSWELQFHKMVHDADDNFYIGGRTTGNPYPKKDPGNGAYVHTGFPLFGNFPFVSKFDKDCNLIWSTDIPGSDDPEVTRIAVDSKYKSIYVLNQITRYNYPIVNGGGFMNTTGFPTLTKFDSTYKMVWSTRLPAVYGGDIEADTSGNIYAVGSSYGGQQFPYVDPGNGAYTDPNPSNQSNVGSILKFDSKTNLVWATTYIGNKNFGFSRVIHEKYRNLIHIYGIMNCATSGIPTQNDACNGSYYYPSSAPNNNTDPLITSFTTTGKLLYASFNHFPYSYYDILEMNADYKGNLLFEFGYLQEVVNYPFTALKDPGNGAFFQNVSNQTASLASVLMKLTPSILNVISSYTLPKNCDSTGTITITPTCGNGEYSYEWNRGDTTSSIKNVSAGNYKVKITDKNTGVSKIVTIKLPNPPGNIQSATITSVNSYCNQQDGKIRFNNIVGGSTPYSFEINNQVYSNTSVYDSVKAGKYQITVRDKDGCYYKDSVNIIDVPGPKTINTSITFTACNQATGAIHIDSIQSGTAPYNFSLNGNIATRNITGLNANKYVLSVTDSAGCLLSDTIEIKKLNGANSIIPILDNNTCGQTTGGITITKVAGGIPPYLFSLDSVTYNADSVFSNLNSGTKYLYVQDKNGCVYRDSVSLIFKKFPFIHLPVDTILCDRATLLLDVTQNGATYTWQDGSVLNKILVDKPGVYVANVTVNGCSTRDSCTVHYQNTPSITISGNILKCIEDTLRWNITLANSKYLWQDGSTQPFYNVIKAGLYSYKVYNFCGEASGLVNVQTHPCLCDVVVPNIFSPNGDGINDEFKPQFFCTPSVYRITIFDRNGQPVFDTKDANESWKGLYNGKQVPIGTYYYILEIKGMSDPLVRERAGSITIIR